MSNTSTETVTVTIDDTPVTVPKGTLVIEASRQVGVMIPHFCYHPKLAPDANCRMCLVEIEKVPRLQTSCSTPVTEGMVVRTATTVVNDAHKSVLEFILANHPLDCPVCDQGGRCDLQDFSHQYTPSTSRFLEIKRVFPKEYFSPLIETQMNRCVQCLRCVRYCNEVMDVKALAPAGRGTMTEIKHFTAHQLDCEFCGGCVQICPVGAITSRLSMYEYRPWMLKRAETTCTFCGDGCHLTIQTKSNDLIEVNSAQGAGRNNGDLCPRGFFGFQATSSPDRLRRPMIRREGRLVEATWEEAFEFVADTALRLKTLHGPDAFAGLISSRCTNEDLYVFQKFMRTAIGTNQIDSAARYGQMNGIRSLRRVQGIHRWTVQFEDIVKADTLLLVGTNITETNPITGLKVKEAVKQHGATLLTVEALEPDIGTISNIVNLSSHHFSSHPASYKNVVLGLVKGVAEEGLISGVLSQRAPDFVQALKDKTQALEWSHLEQATGSSKSALAEAGGVLARSARIVILVGPGVLRTPGGEEVTTLLQDLLLLTGHLGQPGCGVAPLAEENNDQGAVEMGAVAEYLPGPIDLHDPPGTARLAEAWDAHLAQGHGKTLLEIVEAAHSGRIKAVFVVGENPVGSLPPSVKTQEACEGLELLVCQELFLTETARLAHVVFPACSYAEKDGTFTNTEGHVQPVRQAIDPIGESRPDWEILAALSDMMGHPMDYEDAKSIFKEIKRLIPGYRLIGPAPQASHSDESVMDRYLRSGYQEGLEQRFTTVPASRSAQDSITVQLVQSLFHSGKLSTYSKGLMQVHGAGALALNPHDAERVGVKDGDHATVLNGLGQVSVPVKLLDRVPRGLATFPEHFAGDLKALFSTTKDPSTGTPYFRLADATLEKTP